MTKETQKTHTIDAIIDDVVANNNGTNADGTEYGYTKTQLKNLTAEGVIDESKIEYYSDLIEQIKENRIVAEGYKEQYLTQEDREFFTDFIEDEKKFETERNAFKDIIEARYELNYATDCAVDYDECPFQERIFFGEPYFREKLNIGKYALITEVNKRRHNFENVINQESGHYSSYPEKYAEICNAIKEDCKGSGTNWVNEGTDFEYAESQSDAFTTNKDIIDYTHNVNDGFDGWYEIKGKPRCPIFRLNIFCKKYEYCIKMLYLNPSEILFIRNQLQEDKVETSWNYDDIK